MLPVKADTKFPFVDIQDLGRAVKVIVDDPQKFRKKSVSVVGQFLTPSDLLGTWNKGTPFKITP
jgi:hypothetical protein